MRLDNLGPVSRSAVAIPLLLTLLLAAFVEAEPTTRKFVKSLALDSDSTFASRSVADRELRLWRASSARYPLLKISANRDEALFQFSGKGGAIGRLSSIRFSRTVDDRVRMTGSASGLDGITGKYLWGVYGWILDRPEWGRCRGAT